MLECRYQEKFYFNPGDTGFQVFETKYAKIGVAICWDQWFPEAARCMALMGAEASPQALQMLSYRELFADLRTTPAVHHLCRQCIMVYRPGVQVSNGLSSTLHSWIPPDLCA